MEHDFMERTAKIIAKIRTITYIDAVDAEGIKDILQDELKEYYDAINECYNNECYDDGYDEGYADGKSSLGGDVESAYEEGYALGYSDGHSEVKL